MPYGEAFSVQPSEISLVTMTLNGAQIDTLLEQQFDNPPPRILQASKGFSYAWNESAPVGNMVDISSNISSIKINGTSINPSNLYRVTVNNRIADGSYNLFVLKEGVNRTETTEIFFSRRFPSRPEEAVQQLLVVINELGVCL